MKRAGVLAKSFCLAALVGLFTGCANQVAPEPTDDPAGVLGALASAVETRDVRFAAAVLDPGYVAVAQRGGSDGVTDTWSKAEDVEGLRRLLTSIPPGEEIGGIDGPFQLTWQGDFAYMWNYGAPPRLAAFSGIVSVALGAHSANAVLLQLPVYLQFARNSRGSWLLTRWEGVPLGTLPPPPGVFVPRDEEPLLVHSVPVVYPPEAKAQGIEGRVVLNICVAVDGTVISTRVVQGVPLLNDAAIQAARQYLFKPAMSNGKPVGTWVQVPFSFSLT